MFRFLNANTLQFGPSVVSLRPLPLQRCPPTSPSQHSVLWPTSCSPELDHFCYSFPNPQKMAHVLRLGRAPNIKTCFFLSAQNQHKFLLTMSHNFTLSPEDRLLWQTRAPCASYWLGVSNHHPFIDGGWPVPLPEVTFPPYGTTLPPPGAIPPQFQTTIPPLGTILPPPPYTSTQPPTLPTSASQPYLAGSQPSMLGAAPFLPGNSVPIYNIRHQNRTPATAENPSSPSCTLDFYFIHFIYNGH